MKDYKNETFSCKNQLMIDETCKFHSQIIQINIQIYIIVLPLRIQTNVDEDD